MRIFRVFTYNFFLNVFVHGNPIDHMIQNVVDLGNSELIDLAGGPLTLPKPLVELDYGTQSPEGKLRIATSSSSANSPLATGMDSNSISNDETENLFLPGNQPGLLISTTPGSIGPFIPIPGSNIDLGNTNGIQEASPSDTGSNSESNIISDSSSTPSSTTGSILDSNSNLKGSTNVKSETTPSGNRNLSKPSSSSTTNSNTNSLSDYPQSIIDLKDDEIIPQSLAQYTQVWDENYKKYHLSVQILSGTGGDEDGNEFTSISNPNKLIRTAKSDFDYDEDEDEEANIETEDDDDEYSEEDEREHQVTREHDEEEDEDEEEDDDYRRHYSKFSKRGDESIYKDHSIRDNINNSNIKYIRESGSSLGSSLQPSSMLAITIAILGTVCLFH